jgi:hypothetical protein
MKKILIILLIVFSLVGCSNIEQEQQIKEKELICGFSQDIECLNIEVTGNQLLIDIKGNSSSEIEVYEIKAYGAGTCGREMFNEEKFPFKLNKDNEGRVGVVCNNVVNLEKGSSELMMRYNDLETGELKTAYGFIGVV